MAGSRLYTGRWTQNGEWGTVLKTNLGDNDEVVSYDVFMDTSTKKVPKTVPVADVEKAVADAREMSGSQNGSGSGVSGERNTSVADSKSNNSPRRNGVDKGGRLGVEEGSGSSKGRTIGGQNGKRGCDSKEAKEDTDDEGEGRKSKKVSRRVVGLPLSTRNAWLQSIVGFVRNVLARAVFSLKDLCVLHCGALVVGWEQKQGSSKDTSKEAKEQGQGSCSGKDSSKDTSNDGNTLWKGGDGEGAAKVGRAFNVKGSPDEMWDTIFSTHKEELGRLGHHTLQHRRVKQVRPVSSVSSGSPTCCTFLVTGSVTRPE